MDNELLDLRYLARYYNEILGPQFRVVVNSLEYPERDINKTVVTLHAQRVPFAVSNVHAETLSVTLNFRILARRKLEILSAMQKLLGPRSFNIETYREVEGGEPVPDKVFRINSFLSQDVPAGDPSADTGEYMVDYQITGTVLVSDSNDGTIVANDIKTAVNGVELAVLACKVQLSRQSEAPVKAGDDRARPVILAQSTQYTITALHCGRAIDYELARDIELPNADMRKTYTLRRTFPNGSVIEKRCLLLGGELTEPAGAYAQYTAVLQEV